MAKVGAQRAAELTGRSKSTIQRAMKSGKISFEMDNNGRRVIDVSELERAFGLQPQSADVSENRAVEAEIEKATQMLELERLKMRIRFLEDQLDVTQTHIEEIKEQRDQWQKQAQQTLITSQYSQKQAEELKEELKERDRRARMARRQQMEQRAAKAAGPMRGDNQNGPAAGKGSFDIQGLWHKLRGQNDKKEEAVASAAAEPKERAAG